MGSQPNEIKSVKIPGKRQKPNKPVIEVRSGRVIIRNFWMPVAPSASAASKTPGWQRLLKSSKYQKAKISRN